MNVKNPAPGQSVPTPPADHKDQWYHKNPALYAAEVTSMRSAHRNARLVFLPQGDMAWNLELKSHQGNPWRLLLRYRKDRPTGQECCDTVRAILVEPDLTALKARAKAVSGGAGIPHVLHWAEASCDWLSVAHVGQKPDVNSFIRGGEYTARRAEEWIDGFERALADENAWRQWCGHPASAPPAEAESIQHHEGD